MYLFQDYIFSGIALLIVNGISNPTAAVLIMMKKKTCIVLGGVFGIALMLWICIQFVIFPPNFMSTSYFVFGLIEALTGYMTWVFQKQEEVYKEAKGKIREVDYILVHHANRNNLVS